MAWLSRKLHANVADMPLNIGLEWLVRKPHVPAWLAHLGERCGAEAERA